MSAMNIYSIYKATCLTTGKSYIGFDSNWPQRMWEHKCYSRNKKNNKFYNAIRKYGLDDFEWSVIYQSKDRKHTLKEMETFFIKQYDSMKNGYNSTLGGEGQFGTKHNETQKQTVSKPITINGVVYDSIKEATLKLKVSRGKLSNLKKGKNIIPIENKNSRSGVYNGMSKSIMVMGVNYQSKTEALNQLNIGWKLLNKIINENLDCIPEQSLKRSQNSFKGFANKLGDNENKRLIFDLESIYNYMK